MQNNKTIYKRVALTVVVVVLCAALAYIGYYYYRQSQVDIYPYQVFTLTSQTPITSAQEMATRWIEEYLKQFQQDYLNGSRRLNDWQIDSVEVLDEEALVVQVDFTIFPYLHQSQYFSGWGMQEDKWVSCQWVLYFTQQEQENEYWYSLLDMTTPAAWQTGEYISNGQAQQDEDYYAHYGEIPYSSFEQYDYKIENQICYVTFDGGQTFSTLPLTLQELCDVGDGNPYYNRLQDGSYCISEEVAAFVYGGTLDTPLSIMVSHNQGQTWSPSIVSINITGARLRFVSFVNAQVGFVVCTDGRTMSQEGQIIFQTKDGGQTWEQIGYGPHTWLLVDASFVNETTGFLCYTPVQGAALLYRTQDGGQSFEEIALPLSPDYQDIFIQPLAPFVEEDHLSLYISQGDMGDYQGGLVCAHMVSYDNGATWEFAGLYTPPSEEIG